MRGGLSLDVHGAADVAGHAGWGFCGSDVAELSIGKLVMPGLTELID